MRLIAPEIAAWKQLQKPCTRRVPRRLDSTATVAAAHVFEDAKTYYRSVYYAVLDVAHGTLQTRFDQNNFKVGQSLEESLMNGTT